jgi:hypothetical protein
MTTFNPKSKSFYKRQCGRLLMSHAGQPCIVIGTVIYPANQTKSRREEIVTEIRFAGSAIHFLVRPCDLTD